MKRVIAGFSLELAATKQFWRAGTFAFIALVNMVFTLAIDCHYGQSKAGVLIFTRLVVSCTTICIALISSGLFFRRDRKTWAGIVFNVLLFVLLDAFGDSVMGLTLVGLGVRQTTEILGSLRDAAIYDPFFFAVTVYLVSVGFRQEKLELKVASLVNQLAYLQFSGAELVKAERDRLTSQVQQLLGPKLTYAKSMIQDSNDSAEISGVLKFLNQSDLRPLASQLSDEQGLFVQEPATLNSIRLQPLSSFNLAKSLNPGLFIVLAAILLLFLNIFDSQELDARDFAALLAGALVLAAFQLILRKLGDARRSAMVLVQLAALVLVSSAGLLTHSLFHYQESSLAFGFLLACLTSAFVISSMVALYSQRNTHLQTSLVQLESDLSVAVSSIKQRRWVDRRRVVTQLHGQVQGALVAAVARISNPSDPDRIQKAKQDIDSANFAIKDLEDSPTDLDSVLQELQRTWDGICEIDFEVDQKAGKLIASSTNTSFVTSALITEGVLNAVRHGNATKVQVSIAPFKGKALKLAVADNGKLKVKRVPGGGFALMNELSTNWSIKRNAKKTVLEMYVAHVPDWSA